MAHLRRSCRSVSRSRWIATGELEPPDDVEGLEQPHAVHVRELRGIGTGIGKRAGLGDRSQEASRSGRRRREARGSLSTTARYMRASSSGLGSAARARPPCVHLSAQAPIGARTRRADYGTVQAFKRDRAAAARQTDAIAHRRDGANRCIGAPVARDEQYFGLLADVHRERGGYIRKDDNVVQRNQQQVAPSRYLFSSRYRKNTDQPPGVPADGIEPK